MRMLFLCSITFPVLKLIAYMIGAELTWQEWLCLTYSFVAAIEATAAAEMLRNLRD